MPKRQIAALQRSGDEDEGLGSKLLSGGGGQSSGAFVDGIHSDRGDQSEGPSFLLTPRMLMSRALTSDELTLADDGRARRRRGLRRDGLGR